MTLALALSLLTGGATTTNSAPFAGAPIAALKVAETNKEKSLARLREDPQIKREIAAFEKAVANAKTPQELLKNPSVRNVMMTAAGLESFKDYTGLVTRALTSDINDPASLANRLGETRSGWKSLTRTFDFANRGLSLIKVEVFRKTTIDQFVEAKWRDSLEAQAPGLSLAMEFKARAASFDSPIKILGDGVGREVVTTALGIPKQLAFQPIKSQEAAIARRLDVSKLQDPAFVDQFIRRYLTTVQQQGQSAGIIA